MISLAVRRPHGNLAILTAVAIFAVLCGVFAYLHNPSFLSVGNIISIAQSTSSIGIGALGMAYLIGASFFDLSVSGIVPLAAVAMGYVYAVIPGPYGEVAAILAALLVGLVAGAINGVLVTRARIPAFVTTLGTLFLFISIVELVTNGGTVTIDGPVPAALASETVLTVVPLGIILLLVLAVILNYALWRTRVGRYIRFIGVSQRAAQVWGVPVKWTVFLAFCLCGVTAAIASIVLAGMFSSATATMAVDFNLNTIAAVVIGGTRLEGGRTSIIGTVVGAFLLAEITDVLTIIGVNPYFQYIAVGALLVIVVGLGNARLRRRHAVPSGRSPMAVAGASTQPDAAQPNPSPAQTGGTATAAAAIELVDVSHAYAENLVLRHVNFAAYPGQCLGLLGQNGAGKSTIINILTGKIRPTAGTIRLGGAPIVLLSPRAARGLGIAVVAQELELAPTLSVADNIVLGVEPTRRGLFLDHAAKRRIAAHAIARLGVALDPNATVEELPLGEQQLTEICRSLAMNARVIIFDEPTSSLDADESRRLLGVIAELRRAGCAVVFVSHKMGEVLEICDTLCVLRDGKVVGTGTPAELGGPEGVTALLLNKAPGTASVRTVTERQRGKIAISLRNLRTANARVERLDCYYGEILGFAGVEGSGSTEAIEALAGLQEFRADSFRVGDATTPFPSPDAAVRAGIVALPPDRKNEGIFAELTIAENIGLGTDLPRRAIFRAISWAEDKALFARTRALLAIKTEGPMQSCQSLSGGNQQKVLFGRAMAAGARIWLLAEPTRGIDVGAREELYALIRERAASGWCVIIKSIDPAELAAVCDRACVFVDGQIRRELGNLEISEEAIYSAGLPEAVAG